MFDVFISIRSLAVCPSCILMSMALIGGPAAFVPRNQFISPTADIYFNPDKENSWGLIYFVKDERQKINNHEDTKIIVSSDHQSATSGIGQNTKTWRVTEQ